MRATHNQSGLTFRSVAVGLIGTAILGVVTPYCDLVLQGTWIAACHLPIGAFVLFLALLCVANSALKMMGARFGFTGRELLTSYSMMLVGAGIPSFGLTEYLFPSLVGAYYYARPENRWIEETYQYLPQWMFPWNVKDAMRTVGASPPPDSWVDKLYESLPAWALPQGKPVVVGFYEGLKPNQSIPWGAWVVPMAAWTFLALTFFFTLICISVILRKQWIERDRLILPLVQLPLDMVREVEETGVATTAFFKNQVMWCGFAIPAFVHSVNGLNFYFPFLPKIPLDVSLNQYLQGPAFSQIGPFIILVHFSIIGFTYLLSVELSFSLWFFFFFYMAQSVVLSLYGIQMKNIPGYATPAHAGLQMLGAFLAIVGYMAWAGREHLRDVLRTAMGFKVQGLGLRIDSSTQGNPQPSTLNPDVDEPLSYRLAFWGVIVGVLIMSAWCKAAGASFTVALLSWVIVLIIAIVLTRFVSEGGLLFVQAFRPSDLMIAAVGSAPIGAHTLTAMAFVEKVFMFDLRTLMMPSLMDSYRIADGARINKRKLLPALVAAILVAVASSSWSLLTLVCHRGAVKMMTGSGGWFLSASPQQQLTFALSYINDPRAPTPFTWICLIIGVGVTLFLYFMRARFTWWFLHPIGYAMGPSWPMIQLWFSILVGWLCKWVILRYGGMAGFRNLRLFFMGLIVGEFTTAGAWLIIDTLCGKSGHRFFLF
jgi:hypothetical protein